MSRWGMLLAIAGLCCGGLSSRAADTVAAMSPSPEEAAWQAAIARAAPAIVRIETIGGLERVEGQLAGEGATTGVIVRDDGYVVTSSYNLAHRPTAAIVTLDDGRRVSATIVGADHAKLLTLLRLDEPGPYPAVESAEPPRVGQTALAAGKPFDASQVARSVGIISAVDRLFGRAIQTDARVSPLHYGGPLLDVAGRCWGVIVPMSPMGSGVMAGAELYDSGIGFAVPLDAIRAVLPRWIEQRELHPGMSGLRFADKHPLSTSVVLDELRPRSPAARAGLRKGDTLLSCDGRTVRRLTDVLFAHGARYAGDVMQVEVRREEEVISASLPLVEKIGAYRTPYLGLIPAPYDGSLVTRVAAVLEGSPAALAGLQPGDGILLCNGRPAAGATQLERALATQSAGDEAQLKIQRGDAEQTITCTLADLAAAPTAFSVERKGVGEPVDLPPASETRLVPGPQAAPGSCGLVLVFDDSPAGAAVDWSAWQAFCERERFVVEIRRPLLADQGWQAVDPIRALEILQEHAKNSAFDPRRVAIVAAGEAVPVAAKVAADMRENLVRGLATLGPPPDWKPENAPERRFEFFAAGKTGVSPRKFQGAVRALGEQGYTVTTAPAAAESWSTPMARDALFGWLAALDRL